MAHAEVLWLKHLIEQMTNPDLNQPMTFVDEEDIIEAEPVCCWIGNIEYILTPRQH
jgi:hypothetical protein